jgi:hypothetical protein
VAVTVATPPDSGCYDGISLEMMKKPMNIIRSGERSREKREGEGRKREKKN